MKPFFLKISTFFIYFTFSITNIFSQSFSPMFSTLSGRYNSDIEIQLTSSDSNADIFYTLDGSDPNSSSLEYSGNISIAGDGSVTTIKAITISNNSSISKISSAKYIIDYTFDPNAEYLTDLSWNEYNDFIKGDWFGYTTTPWTFDYCVELSILSDLKYIDKSTSTSRLGFEDDIFDPVFYYGVSDISSLKKIELYDILSSGYANGFVDILFQGGNTNTDHLRYIKFIDENNLYLEMWHSNTYGPLKYFLTKERTIKTNTSEVSEYQKSLVFPNPASDFITIKSLNSNIQLVNQIGQSYFFEKSKTISVSHLPRGLYIICFTNDEGNEIKQKVILN